MVTITPVALILLMLAVLASARRQDDTTPIGTMGWVYRDDEDDQYGRDPPGHRTPFAERLRRCRRSDREFCSDANPCTVDYIGLDGEDRPLQVVRKPRFNNVGCRDACIKNGTGYCYNGNCTGTCMGHCPATFNVGPVFRPFNPWGGPQYYTGTPQSPNYPVEGCPRIPLTASRLTELPPFYASWWLPWVAMRNVCLDKECIYVTEYPLPNDGRMTCTTGPYVPWDIAGPGAEVKNPDDICMDLLVDSDPMKKCLRAHASCIHLWWTDWTPAVCMFRFACGTKEWARPVVPVPKRGLEAAAQRSDEDVSILFYDAIFEMLNETHNLVLLHQNASTQHPPAKRSVEQSPPPPSHDAFEGGTIELGWIPPDQFDARHHGAQYDEDYPPNIHNSPAAGSFTPYYGICRRGDEETCTDGNPCTYDYKMLEGMPTANKTHSVEHVERLRGSPCTSPCIKVNHTGQCDQGNCVGVCAGRCDGRFAYSISLFPFVGAPLPLVPPPGTFPTVRKCPELQLTTSTITDSRYIYGTAHPWVLTLNACHYGECIYATYFPWADVGYDCPHDRTVPTHTYLDSPYPPIRPMETHPGEEACMDLIRDSNPMKACMTAHVTCINYYGYAPYGNTEPFCIFRFKCSAHGWAHAPSIDAGYTGIVPDLRKRQSGGAESEQPIQGLEDLLKEMMRVVNASRTTQAPV